MNSGSSSTERDSGWNVSDIDHSCTRLRSGGAGKICRSMPNERYEGRRDCMPLKDYTVRIRMSRWHDAFGLLHVMPRQGLLPDVISYSAAISACEKGQQPQQALQLLLDMRLKGLLPNVISYSATISACEKGP